MEPKTARQIRCLWWDRYPNFGDQMARILVSRLSGRVAVNDKVGSGRELTVGSILHLARPTDRVWGAGLLSDHLPAYLPTTGELSVFAVRGPLTRRVLLRYGGVVPEVYGDPGLLIPSLHPHVPTAEFSLGLVPHLLEQSHAGTRLGQPGVLLIDVRDGVSLVLGGIARCQRILASSLHGLIAAEAMGLPARHVRFLPLSPEQVESAGMGDFKFRDYYQGTGRDYPGPTVAAEGESAFALAERAFRIDLPSLRFDPRLLLAACPFNYRNVRDARHLAHWPTP